MIKIHKHTTSSFCKINTKCIAVPKMNQFFRNKRVLVTGAANGIGRGITQRLVGLGSTVLALDISAEQLKPLQKQFPSLEPVQVDLSDWSATKKAVKSLYPIDLCVNNAGVAICENMLQVSEQSYDKSFNVNAKAVFNVSQAVIENLISRNSPGSIVNISSKASKAALPDLSVYCATKGAVDGLTRALAMEFGPKKIRINSVNPTIVMTDLGKQAWHDVNKREPMLAKIPLERFADVEDVVDAVIFLLSDKSSMITGSCLPVDGGFLAC